MTAAGVALQHCLPQWPVLVQRHLLTASTYQVLDYVARSGGERDENVLTLPDIISVRPPTSIVYTQTIRAPESIRMYN